MRIKSALGIVLLLRQCEYRRSCWFTYMVTHACHATSAQAHFQQTRTALKRSSMTFTRNRYASI